ncbi:hypothetical protein MY11210_003510 [Beauveria gryllotalpidicola]
MSNSYYKDQEKLADARALARSFSRTKPPKFKGNSRPRAHSQGRGAELRGAARSQLTQSIVRTYLGPLITFQKVFCRSFWLNQSSEESNSLVIVQLAVAPKAELPPTLSHTAQTQSSANAEAPTLAAAGSVLDEFFALMSQQEKELAQVDPLIDQLQQWHLQSPAVPRSKTVAMPAAPQPHPSFTGWKKASVEEIPAATVPNTPVVQSGQTNGQICPTHVSGVATSEQPSRLPLGDASNCFPKLWADAALASPFESSKSAVRLPPTPQQEENIRPPLEAIEQLVRPPRTPNPAKCNCTPTIKPQKGLSASRFASKETGNCAFANKFSVNLQIIIHQDFCPMSERHRSMASEGKYIKSVQQALRAEAEPFTPRS